MSETTDQFDVMFYQLILSLQQTAMIHLGKVMSPVSGKIERHLVAAQQNIGLLETIQRKTKGNLTDDEQKLLDHMLFELRMNYVEEANKPSATDEADKSSDSSTASSDDSSRKADEAESEGEAEAGGEDTKKSD
jgi:hypothetical protein